MPESIEVKKGTEINTTAGVVVVPSDTYLYSHGAYMRQVRLNLSK